MSLTLRRFNSLIEYAWHPDYKSVYHIMAMGIRKDGTVVFSNNGAAVFPPADKLIVKIAHAEQRISRKLDKGAEVYVVRLTRDKQLAMARPCSTCYTVLRARGVKRVYYSIAPGEYGVLEF
jgi:tRNA(Arg) A34 adenosine deaminase TadA